MTSTEGATARADHQRPRGLAPFLRSQMRNIAPFLTLIFLSAFFAIASPSFATIDNVGNILTQVSVTGIIAVGLTFVILCAEIDLSIASIANVTGIAVAYFTLQESYVNIANVPMPGIVAILRDRFNASEILVSLMLVYVANLLLSYLVFGPWKDPKGFNFPQTMSFASGTALPRIVTGLRAHWGLAVALLAAAVMWVFMFRTFRGYQLQVGGLAPAAARYAGFSSRRALWTALLVSGGLAGVAGAFEAVGPAGQLTPHLSTGYGFTAIIVAFVGRLHPVGCVLGSVLLSMFLIGGELSQSRIGLPSALTGVFQGVLLFSLLACDTLITYRFRWRGPTLARGAAT